MSITYTIKKKAKDILDATIEKTGHALELNIGDVIRHIAELSKMKKEMQGNYYLAKAFMHNIESNHPYIKKLEDHQLDTVILYGQKRGESKDANTALTMIEEQVAKYEDLAKGLVEQIGLPEDSELHKAIAEHKEIVSEAKATFDKAFHKSKAKKNEKNK